MSSNKDRRTHPEIPELEANWAMQAEQSRMSGALRDYEQHPYHHGGPGGNAYEDYYRAAASYHRVIRPADYYFRGWFLIGKLGGWRSWKRSRF